MSALWTPSEEAVAGANLTEFRRQVNDRYARAIGSYAELHQWSIDEPEQFWTALWDFVGVVANTHGREIIRAKDMMPGASFFPEARLNFAENLLRRQDQSEAIVFRGEDNATIRLTYAELRRRVNRVSTALRGCGVKPGDRIAAITANIPEAVICMLATAAIGAVWASCSPDFGAQGIRDRFEQIEPRVLFAVDGYYYNGKRLDIRDKVAEVKAALSGVEQLIVMPFTGSGDVSGGVLLSDFETGDAGAELEFEILPFNHPLYIMFSSGTTGRPKCIVHGAGGTLLQHLKEHKLHCDLKPGDRIFYFTTCGWMMWNWLVSALASEASLMLYDGSPFHPDGYRLFEYADHEHFTHFGTSAKFIQALEKFEVKPRSRYALESLRQNLSTGSPLAPEGFDYVYREVKQDVCLSSISGGTDIISCFIGGDPTGPVHRGEIQGKALGMAVEVWDEEGRAVVGQKGELVCTQSFPSMPLGFWRDDDGSRYHAAYFEQYPGVWAQGDYAEVTSNGGFIMYGRSDATLNPGGVRIGTAEIYRQVELMDEVMESIAVGQDWEGDTRVVLFVVLRPDVTLDEDLGARIRERIRTGASPRHVPARIVQVSDIPRTRSGKLTELAIRDLIHGRDVKNIDAIANPEALDQFRDRQELAT